MNADIKTINARLDALLAQVRIAPAGKRQALMVKVRKLRADRDLLLLAR